MRQLLTVSRSSPVLDGVRDKKKRFLDFVLLNVYVGEVGFL